LLNPACVLAAIFLARFSSVDVVQLTAGLIKFPLFFASRAFRTLFNCNPNTRGPERVVLVPGFKA
jgi:hypothetical protein